VYGGWRIVIFSEDRAFHEALSDPIVRAKLGLGYAMQLKLENFSITRIEVGATPISIEKPRKGCFLLDAISIYSSEINQSKLVLKVQSKNIVPYTIAVAGGGSINSCTLKPFETTRMSLIVNCKPNELKIYLKPLIIPIAHYYELNISGAHAYSYNE